MQTCWGGNIPTEIAGSSSVPVDVPYREWNGEELEAEFQKINVWIISEGVSCTWNARNGFYMNLFICLEKYSYKGL